MLDNGSWDKKLLSGSFGLRETSYAAESKVVENRKSTGSVGGEAV